MALDQKHIQKIFLILIQEYNKKKQYYDHYVQVGKKAVMVVEWHKGHWKYHVEDLEQWRF